MTTHHLTIADDAYLKVQGQLELISRLLLDPKHGLGRPALDLFIERAERSLAVGPILHPSEFRDGVENLQQVLVCAHALRDARDRIVEVA